MVKDIENEIREGKVSTAVELSAFIKKTIEKSVAFPETDFICCICTRWIHVVAAPCLK